MDEHLPHIDLIDKYYFGLLTEQEREEFEKKRSSDPDFNKEVALHGIIVESLKEMKEDEEFLGKLKVIDQQIEDPELRFPGARRILMLAATFLLLVGSSVSIYMMFQKNTPDKLFQLYYSSYFNELVEYTRSPEVPAEYAFLSDDAYKKLVEGMRNYDNNQYAAAASLLQEVMNETDSTHYKYPEILYYLAMATQENGDDGLAAAYLEKVLTYPNNKYYSQSQWYLALLYVKTEKTEQAIKLLESIDYYSPFGSQAIELRRKLFN